MTTPAWAISLRCSHRLSNAIVFTIGTILAVPGCATGVNSTNIATSPVNARIAATPETPPVTNHAGRTATDPKFIVFQEAWGHYERKIPASNVPDSIKYVYENADGTETSDVAHAVKRIPVARIRTVSTDAYGTLVAPDKATHFSITYYGTDGKVLRHTTAMGDEAPGMP